MTVYLLYGPGEVSKRAEVLRLRKQVSLDNIVQVDLKQASVDFFQNVIRSTPLFSDGPRMVIVENAGEKLDLNILVKGEDDLNLIIVAAAAKESSPLLQSAKKIGAKIMSFEGEKELSVFPFLDFLIEKKQQAFVELDKLLSEYGGIYILSMISYLLRRNILPLPPSPFLQKKIVSQRKDYQLKDWIRLYRDTLRTEFKIKSGLAEEKISLTQLVFQFTSRN